MLAMVVMVMVVVVVMMMMMICGRSSVNTHDHPMPWALAGSRKRALQTQRLPDGLTHPVVSAPPRAGVTATGDWRATPARHYGPCRMTRPRGAAQKSVSHQKLLSAGR